MAARHPTTTAAPALLSSSTPDRSAFAADALADVIERLPYRQRLVIVCRYWAEWSEAELAEALGCRPGTVKSVASRALASLRTQIEDHQR